MNQRTRKDHEAQPVADSRDQSGYAEQRGKQTDPAGWGEAHAASPLGDGGDDRSSLSDGQPGASNDRERGGRADNGSVPNQGQDQGFESFGARPHRGSGQALGSDSGNAANPSLDTEQPQAFRGEAVKDQPHSDGRLLAEINQRLTDLEGVDTSDIAVRCEGGVVTLEGSVTEQGLQHRVEDLVQRCDGVDAIDNRITIRGDGGGSDGN